MTARSSFVGPFAHDLCAFLAWKRCTGRFYYRAEYRLHNFDRFTAEHAEHGVVALARVVTLWLSRHEGRCKPTTRRAEFSLARQFCLFLRRSDPRCFVPGPELSRRGTRFLPFIFSVKDVRRILRGTDTLRACRSSTDPLFRRTVFRTLILVLFCTGLRFGEALRLSMRDVDLRRRVFFIANSKDRSRWVPFHDGLARHLRAYVRARSAITSPDGPFFVKPTGEGYRYVSNVGSCLRLLFNRLGMRPANGRVGPRPYELRHSFAIHRLTLWYRAGVDLQGHLPWLSAYMGHDDLLGTETYLRATPELLASACRRFAKRLRQMESL